MKITDLSKKAEASLQKGDLNQAATLYEELLKHDSTNLLAMHRLGIVYLQLERLDQAEDYLEKSYALSNYDQTIGINLANLYKLSGKLDKSITLLSEMIAHHPKYPPAWNNLGTLYFAKNELKKSEHAFQKAIHLNPDYIDALYNLGLILIKQDRLNDASDCFRNLLKKTNQHFAAQLQLAKIHIHKQELDEAIRLFNVVLTVHPFHFETQTNLATCYLKKGDLQTALDHYNQALAIQPLDQQVLFNMGVIHMTLGNWDNAIRFFQKTLQQNPDSFEAHNNLGVIFLNKNYPSFALKHFEEAYRLQPSNQAIAYTISAISQKGQPQKANPDYIKTLFNAYADHYEPHLRQALEYQIPEHFLATLNPFIRKNLNVLDLGCGTGLAAQPIKNYAKFLTGVDLSEKMLQIAGEKGIYDKLLCEDLETFLQTTTEQFDLIMAADVLTYYGDLVCLFQRINSTLANRGLFIFNFEPQENEAFTMQQSGRFTHSQDYINHQINQLGWHLLSKKTVVTRLQNQNTVPGLIYLIQKKS